jgi:ribonuclease D
MDADFKFIDTMEGLKKLVETFNGVGVIAADLEADSMYHFREKVCLIQLAVPGVKALVDPLKLKDLDPLKPYFASEKIIKIFHGADYDMRSLHRDFGIEVNGLFDTELACRFLGLPQTGLETVLSNFLQVDLDKKYQKKDWSRRPLPGEMIEYAVQDVLHLISLHKIVRKELQKKGRIEWVDEECAILSRVRAPEPNGDPLFLKFKGAGKLDRRDLAILEAVLTCRKEIAQRKDRPLFKVISNSSLMTMAVRKPRTMEALAASRALSPKQLSMYGNELVAAVKHAMRIPAKKLPFYPRKKTERISTRVAQRIKALKAWREQVAQELQIDPGLVCNKSLLTAVSTRFPSEVAELAEIEGMRDWQRTNFGSEMIRVLHAG